MTVIDIQAQTQLDKAGLIQWSSPTTVENIAECLTLNQWGRVAPVFGSAAKSTPISTKCNPQAFLRHKEIFWEKVMNSEIVNLKQELISILAVTDIGFNCTPAAKQQIETLVDKIESNSPTTEPTSQMELVQGRWRLLYSTFGLERETTLKSLSFGKLPNVTVSVTGIFQEIYTVGQQYNNLIEFTVGSSVKGITMVTGCYRVESSKRLNIDFLKTSAKSATNDFVGLRLSRGFRSR